MTNIVIYSKPACPKCDEAKNLCKSKNAEFIEKKLGEDITMEEFTEQFPGVRQMPVITINDNKMDSIDDLKDYLFVTGIGFGGMGLGI